MEESVRKQKAFRRILQKISKDLTDDNLQEMMGLVVGIDGYPGRKDTQNVKSGLEFFLQLGDHDKLSPDNFEELVELLEGVNRKDLVKILQEANGLQSQPQPRQQNVTSSPGINDHFTPPVTSTPAITSKGSHPNMAGATPGKAQCNSSTAAANESSDSSGYCSLENTPDHTASPLDCPQVKNEAPLHQGGVRMAQTMQKDNTPGADDRAQKQNKGPGVHLGESTAADIIAPTHCPPDAGSHTSSFGIHPLTSSEAHQIPQQQNRDPSKSSADSTYSGPTILSPSVSLEGTSQNPAGDSARQSSGAKESMREDKVCRNEGRVEEQLMGAVEGSNCVVIHHQGVPVDRKAFDFTACIAITAQSTREPKSEVTKSILNQLTTLLQSQHQTQNILQQQNRLLYQVYMLLATIGAQLIRIREGSIEFVISFNSKEDLKKFWKAYQSGELQKELAKCLITKDVEKQAQCQLDVAVMIDEAKYKEGVQALGTDSNKPSSATSSTNPAVNGASSTQQAIPQSTQSAPITTHTPTATTSPPNTQDQSVRPKVHPTPVISNQIPTTKQQDLSVRPKERKPVSNSGSSATNTQSSQVDSKPNEQKSLSGRPYADIVTPNSSSHGETDSKLLSSGLEDGRPFKSLTSNPGQLMESILETSDPDPSDCGGDIFPPSAASTESGDKELAQKLEKLALDSDPVVGDGAQRKVAADLETDAPEESVMEEDAMKIDEASTIKEPKIDKELDEDKMQDDHDDDESTLDTTMPSQRDSSGDQSVVSTDGDVSSRLPNAQDASDSADEKSTNTNQRRPAAKPLRAYQQELATPPMNGDNYIICAPTGSGKTLTATAICYHFYKKAVANQSYFKSLFIVNIRHLTRQQRYEFRARFPRGTVRTIGETELLKDILFSEGVSVVMVTAQIVVNALKKRDISLQDISMMIFDECHHTTQNHPYNEIMRMYLKEKKVKVGLKRKIGESGDRLPHVIGLSASLGVGHGKAFDHILTLCGNMDAKNVLQVRENKTELDNFVNAPENDEVRYVSGRMADQRDLSQIIEGIMSQVEAELWDADILVHEHGTQGYEQWIRKQQKDAECAPDRERYIASIYLFEYNKSLILYEDLRASDSLKYLQEFMRQRDLDQEHVPIEDRCRSLFEAELVELKRICRVEENSPNPKLQELASLLREKFESKPESKGIVLCRTRLATIALIEFIQTATCLQGLQRPVNPTRLVGQGESDSYFMTESEQKMSLKKFRNDDSCNLLVATDIAQEGLDMPACNFVIRFNFVSNEIGTVQSKGRARAKQSECYLIVEEDSINANREASNRRKVIDMQQAMDELNELPEGERLEQITGRQEKIYKDLDMKEKMDGAGKRLLGQTSDTVDMLCKECDMLITNGAFMRRRGCHYTCIDPDVKERITVVPHQKTDRYRDSETIGVFKCSNPTCGQKLGIAVNFLQDGDFSLKGYGFSVKSFRFKFSETRKETYKQWKKVPLDIPDDLDP